MPTYPVIHKETGEKKELSMSMSKYDEWKKENPEWDKDWQAGVASTQEMFKWTGAAASSGWNEVLEHQDNLVLMFVKIVIISSDAS